MLKKFLLFVAMGTLVFSMAGCRQEPAEPETADEAIDQIEAEIEQLIAEEEAEAEAFREQPLQEYVPGTIPPGEYVYTYVTENGIEKESIFYFFDDSQVGVGSESRRMSYSYNEDTDIYSIEDYGSMPAYCYSYTGRYEDGVFILLTKTFIGPEDTPNIEDFIAKNYDASTSETEPDGRAYVRQ